MISIPKISHPIYDLVIPSTKVTIKVRPMLAKEEKLLLMAKESQDENDILGAVKQVVNNCLLTKTDIDSLSTFDLEYLFLKLRAFSVSNIIEVTYRDNEDYDAFAKTLQGQGLNNEQIDVRATRAASYNFQVDLNTVEVKYPENADKIIKIDDKTSLRMKYPPASLYTDKVFLAADGKQMIDILIRNCMDAVITDNVAVPFNQVQEHETEEFLDNLPINTMDKVREYLSNLPHVNYEINYTNKQGTERKIVLQTLNDFFILR